MAVTIAAVKPKSICFRHGVRAGEMLMQINGHEIVDILDYQFYATERRLTLTLRSTGENTGRSGSKRMNMRIWASPLTPI